MFMLEKKKKKADKLVKAAKHLLARMECILYVSSYQTRSPSFTTCLLFACCCGLVGFVMVLPHIAEGRQLLDIS